MMDGNVIEVSAADPVSATPQETWTLVHEMFRQAGGAVLMVNDAHAWRRLPDRGQHVLRFLYRELTASRSPVGHDLASGS